MVPLRSDPIEANVPAEVTLETIIITIPLAIEDALVTPPLPPRSVRKPLGIFNMPPDRAQLLSDIHADAARVHVSANLTVIVRSRTEESTNVTHVRPLK